jgi:hypothetical protein
VAHCGALWRDLGSLGAFPVRLCRRCGLCGPRGGYQGERKASERAAPSSPRDQVGVTSGSGGRHLQAGGEAGGAVVGRRSGIAAGGGDAVGSFGAGWAHLAQVVAQVGAKVSGGVVNIGARGSGGVGGIR